MSPILLIFLRINWPKTKKHLIDGLTSLGFIPNSKFMARLSDWMWGHGRIEGPWPLLADYCLCCFQTATLVWCFFTGWKADTEWHITISGCLLSHVDARWSHSAVSTDVRLPAHLHRWRHNARLVVELVAFISFILILINWFVFIFLPREVLRCFDVIFAILLCITRCLRSASSSSS